MEQNHVLLEKKLYEIYGVLVKICTSFILSVQDNYRSLPYIFKYDKRILAHQSICSFKSKDFGL